MAVLVRSSGLCSVARCAIIPLCLLASPVNLFRRVLKVSNIAMLDLSSFTEASHLARSPLYKVDNILICWFFGLNSQPICRAKSHKLPLVSIFQQLFIDACIDLRRWQKA